MKRKFYDELLIWGKKKTPKPMLVIGARQVGKTYIIDKYIKNEYQKFAKLDLLQDDRLINLYQSNLSSEDKYNSLKSLINIDLDVEGILFVDEVQKSPEFISGLKYIRENHQNAKIICAGSLLGVTLEEFNNSFPVGKIEHHYMFPMDFEEFLTAFDENLLLKMIKESYEANKPLPISFHEQALQYYKYYLIVGGMPESVANFVSVNKDLVKYDKSIIENIKDSYFEDMNKHIKNKNMSIRTREIYEQIASQIGNESNKFQYSKIKKNAKARDYFDALNWLKASRFIIKTNLVKNPQIPLNANLDQSIFKLYYEDIGFLTTSLGITTNDILFDNLGIASGWITENYVAECLNNKNDLYYFKNNTSEIDFIIKDLDGIIPIEVKASNNTRSKSLNVYMNKYNPKYGIRLSTKNFGFENNIKSVPLYATFCIKNDILKDK